MREFSTPMSGPSPGAGDRQPHRRRGAQRRRGRGGRGAVPPGRRVGGVARRDRRPVPRRGARGGQGAGGRRGPTGRPGRAHLADPLRVDAVRLRHLVRRWRRGPDLRDLVRRAARVDPARLRRVRRSRRGSLPPEPHRRGPRRPPGAAPRLVDRRQRRRRADPPRRRHLRCGARVAAHHRDAARPGHDHLHLGNHRPSQGLHAHARQLHDRGDGRRPRARRAVRSRRVGRGLDPALLATRARVRARHPARGGAGPRTSGPRRRRREPRP